MIKFVEETHQYFLKDKELISVTTLMQKHNLAPNYAGVSTEVLRAKAERGSLIHKEIEDFNKTGEIGFTTELHNFKKYIEANNIQVLASEVIVYNELVAGTVDLIINENGELIIADIKTTASIHKDAISWQLSIYAYLKGVLGQVKGKVFHFDKEANLSVLDIKLKPLEEVEKLFECERNNQIYKQQQLLTSSQLMQLVEVEELIKSIEIQKKEAELKAKELREALLNAMEENAVKTFENEHIRITYVAPTTRVSIDSTRLKKEHPDIYNEYLKTSEIKASLKITLRGEK